MKFFIAGIMQGSKTGKELHPQDYRKLIREAILKAHPGAEVFCPLEKHPNSLEYDYVTGEEVFFENLKKVVSYDVLVAYAPEASMGTAIEMWEAFKNGRTVVCITQMHENWTVKFLSHKVVESVEEFADFIASGQVHSLVDDISTRRYRKNGSK